MTNYYELTHSEDSQFREIQKQIDDLVKKRDRIRYIQDARAKLSDALFDLVTLQIKREEVHKLVDDFYDQVIKDRG